MKWLSKRISYLDHMPKSRWLYLVNSSYDQLTGVLLSATAASLIPHHNLDGKFPFVPCRGFASSAPDEGEINRRWLQQLWIDEINRREVLRRGRQLRKRENVAAAGDDNVEQRKNLLTSWASYLRPFFSSNEQQQEEVQVERKALQPPISQLDRRFLTPDSPQEARLEPLLSRGTLLIARDIEWANLMFAFEQESRYIILDPCFPQTPVVGFIKEQSNVIFRQLLRSRRPFVAHITDAMGNEIFRVRRPFWWINSTIYAEVDGKEVGVVHKRWHLWRRIYDLYLGNKQFAVVENPGFWNWTFTLKDEDNNVLAQIDRNWRGIGLELFTDAGQYAIRFGDAGSSLKTGLAEDIEELEVARPLSLSERALALALAISLDCDYFSRRGGWGLPFLIATE